MTVDPGVAALFVPSSPSAELLGWRLLAADTAIGRVKVGFEGRPEFCNPTGSIQGGMLAAMLDDAMGPAAFIASGGASLIATIDMTVSYLAPAKPGPFVAEARVVRMGRTVAFLEAELFDAEGGLVARATSSARLTPRDQAPAGSVSPQLGLAGRSA